MKRKLFLTLIIITSILLPSVATAAVVVNSPILINVNPTGNPIYLATDTGYSSAHQAGFITLNENAKYHTNVTLNLSSVPGDGSVVFLTNVISLVNATNTNANVEVWINGTLPAGVQMFYSSSNISYNGVTLSGIKWASGQVIHITNSGEVEHFGFEISGCASGAGQLSIEYSIS